MPRKVRPLARNRDEMTQVEIQAEIKQREQEACTESELEDELEAEIQQGKIEEAEDEARAILSLIEGHSYQEQVKLLGNHLLPFLAVMLFLSGCATTSRNDMVTQLVPSQVTIAVNLNVCKHAHE